MQLWKEKLSHFKNTWAYFVGFLLLLFSSLFLLSPLTYSNALQCNPWAPESVWLFLIIEHLEAVPDSCLALCFHHQNLRDRILLYKLLKVKG